MSAAPEPRAQRGVTLRFVIANPSSWVYFDSLRAQPDGGFAPADHSACPDVDDWKYGMRKLPRYPATRQTRRRAQAARTIETGGRRIIAARFPPEAHIRPAAQRPP
ncbi:hypothetical protein [Paraburkholderia sp. CNPSo 3274]|uniref:hypothetical protein n=1 Tax=Paraburkholderia sp. CNPSo 3274 TaxID=2940932 RepID=UPI0020B690C1|nr:hypothetical protein [Paraburkholderia sp. CNPSo 3274]